MLYRLSHSFNHGLYILIPEFELKPYAFKLALHPMENGIKKKQHTVPPLIQVLQPASFIS